MATFVTGGTGFLGRQIVEQLLEAGDQVVLLVRGGNAAEAAEKARASLGDRYHAAASDGRLTLCLGDLRSPELGLAASDRDLVLSSCDAFLHCAADVRFNRPLSEARAINVDGTQALLRLASDRQRRGPLARVDYVSTAFVAGNRTDLVLESELDGSRGHRNTYELTKFEAETAVRAMAGHLPIAIFRPSIVVGDSENGRTTSFNMIYWPTRVYASGVWRTCPGRPATPLDLAPINFVRDALLAIRRRADSIGHCFHLAAGPERSITLGEISDVVREMFPNRKPVRFVDPEPWMRIVHPILKRVLIGRTRRVVELGEQFVPYFIQNPQFDNATTRAFLAGTSVVVPDARTYVTRLFRYCVESDWGRQFVPSA